MTRLRRPALGGRRPHLGRYALLAAGVLLAVAAWAWLRPRPARHESVPAVDGPAALATDEGATFVGSAVCAECHPVEAQRWRESMHARSMASPSRTSVEAPFAGERFTAHGVTSTFSRRDGRFVVRTDGRDGVLRDFDVAYTFGVSPLQQYLLPIGNGRLQALGVAWDARPAAAGGRRWFHLYPADRVRAGDVQHWTSPSQNWNAGCAECHSTNLRKNYREASDSYETSWSEPNVSCESCHGAGSRHVPWARQPAPRPPVSSLAPAGVVRLGSRDGASWAFDPSTGIAHRNRPRTSRVEVETCARCHARRAPLTDDYHVGRPLADTHAPALLDEGLYFADGQIQDEVFEYGSFLQSRMYAQGVTCSDCHDPHRPEVGRDPDALCQRCHLASRFATPEHHHHRAGSEGSRCVSCHMPARTYMQVDPRRDHSFRVPRPDLSARIGTPNACSGCHRDKSASWAADQARAWYGSARGERPHYGEALAAGRSMAADAEPRLLALVRDMSQPAIARATAVALLSRWFGPGSESAVRDASRDSDPLVRTAAAQVLAGLPPVRRAAAIAPLLDDPVRSVRVHAARALATAAGSLDERARQRRAAGLAEWEAVQRFNADSASARVNLGLFYEETGDLGRAESEYRAGLRMEPFFTPAAVNLADLYRRQGRDDEGARVLGSTIARTPNAAALHYALGLLLVRRGDRAGGLRELQRADELSPNDPDFAYGLGVALYSSGRPDEGIAVLERLASARPAHRAALATLDVYRRERGRR